MASVEIECRCPKCRNPQATSEFYTRSGREITFCDRCGFYADTCDGDVQATSRGVGSFRITYGNGVSRLGSLMRRHTLDHHRQRLMRATRNRNVYRIAVTIREKGKWREKVIFNRLESVRKTERARFKYPFRACEPDLALNDDWI